MGISTNIVLGLWDTLASKGETRLSPPLNEEPGCLVNTFEGVDVADITRWIVGVYDDGLNVLLTAVTSSPLTS